MINQQLLEYVRDQLSAGVAEGEIKKALVTHGWAESDLNEVFTMIEQPQVSSVPTVAPQHTHILKWIAGVVVSLVPIGAGLYMYSSIMKSASEKEAWNNLQQAVQQSTQQTQQILNTVNQETSPSSTPSSTVQSTPVVSPSPTKPPTAGVSQPAEKWSGPTQEYSNATYKFSIDYPSDLTIIASPPGNGRLEVGFMPSTYIVTGVNDSAQFNMEASTNVADISSCLTPATLSPSSETISAKINTTINGTTFLSYVDTYSNNNVVYSYRALHSNICYLMTILVTKNLRSATLTLSQKQLADSADVKMVAKLGSIVQSFKLTQ